MVVSFTGLMGGGKTSWIVEQFHKKPDSIIYYTNVPTSFTYLGDKKDEYVFKDSFFWSKWVKYISDLCFDVLDKDTFKKRYKAVEDQDLYIHNCKIFLDESHMILTSLSPKQIKGFVLFITMSRHVSVDLYLFAQTLSLLNRDIYQLIEMHYYAIPASARLF
ncbi:MAG: zonular occludens toxin domain-containing protein, partial [Campylobacterota bacterium]|nr:zonular occludens toxin domain-containing protein [Campylobacterota bacterium]